MRLIKTHIFGTVVASAVLSALAGCAQETPKTDVVAEAAVETVHAEDAPLTSGLNHVGLTVTDLEASTRFFTETLNWKLAGGVADYPSNFVTDGEVFVTLWRATDPKTATSFNRKTNVGLHHLALTIADVETLAELHETFLADPNVRVEFGPQLNGGGPTVHMMVYEPSGARIEFAVPGGKSRAK